ncbi:MAG: hypothetical protein JWM32_1584 [Verrucomicrobia bacterium]|nr:hypothetical protein [Verrucomicrobiota bacterium]
MTTTRLVIFSVSGVVTAGLIALYHAYQTAMPFEESSDLPQPGARAAGSNACRRPLSARPRDPRARHCAGRVWKKLRVEELRQRPEEGRN